MIVEDFDLDEEIALLEAQGSSADKYYVQSNMHSMAAQKYTVAAKTATDPAHAKTLRAIGKKHKAAADALAAIGGHHVDHLFKTKQAAKQAMPAKLQEDRDMADENDKIEEAYDPVRALIGFAIEGNALKFQDTVNEALRELAGIAVEEVRVAMYEATEDEDDSDGDEDEDEDNEQSVEAGEDDEKLSEGLKKVGKDAGLLKGKHVKKPANREENLGEDIEDEDEEQIDEISVPPTGKTVKADKGKNVSDGDQGPRTIKKVAFSKKKPEQKSVSVSPGDKFREQEAAD